MKLILLYVAVVLCTFCKASGFHAGARYFFSLKPVGLNVGVGMKPKAKSADGGKHHNATAGGQITLASESNFGAGASANIDSHVGTTAKGPALDIIKILNDLASIIDNAVGQGRLNRGRDHSIKETGSSSGDGGGPVSNTETPRQESLAASHGNTETNAGGSGASSQDSGLRTAGDVSADSGDGESESKEGAASVENEQGIELSSGSSVGGSFEYGPQNALVAILQEHKKNTFKHRIEERHNKTGTFTHSGASRENNELQSSSEMSTNSGVGKSDGEGRKELVAEEFGRQRTDVSGSGVSGRQHSSVGVSTNSEEHLNTKESQAPEFNGNEVDGENNSDVSGATILNGGSQSDSGNLNLSSESGGDNGDPSEASNSAGIDVSGKSTCPTDEHLSGSVAAP